MTDDTRPDPDYCPKCQRHYEEECEDGCDCDHCLNRMEAQWQARYENGLTRSERASVERESQIEIQRTVK